MNTFRGAAIFLFCWIHAVSFASPDDRWKRTTFAEENLDATLLTRLEQRIDLVLRQE